MNKLKSIFNDDTKREIKIACEVIMVVFSMCLVTFFMFFAVYKEKEPTEKEEIEENVETFEESEFYELISYEI
ncbi:MAG: hypothetical protein J6A96_00675 [Clostridia bacterium]|nr:hypothetical protein [Clostridia bacterium]